MATLDELDAFGDMDSLDAFTLEQLDNLVLHSASGSVPIALTTSSAANRMQQVSAAETIAFILPATTTVVEYTVTVQDVGGANKYFINGVQQPTLELFEGNTYIFNYPSAHPFKFSTTSDGTHNSGSEYTTGVTHNSSTKVTIVIAASAPTLYYYCSIHSGMGGQANTPVNETSGSGLIQTVASGVAIAFTESSLLKLILVPSLLFETTISFSASTSLSPVFDIGGTAELFMNTSTNAILVLAAGGDITLSLNGTIQGKVLGESWTDITGRDVVWSTLQ